MLSREGTGSLKRKRKLQPVNSRQENYTKLMNYDQFAAWLWKTDFGKEGFGLLRMQIWNPDYPSCDLSFVGVPSLLPSTTRAGLRCALSQPLSPVHLLALIPRNNQVLRSYKSPHQLFLLFWWGCKQREAKQNTPVVPSAWTEPKGRVPKEMRRQLPSRLDVNWIQGTKLEILEPRPAPKHSLLEWNTRSVISYSLPTK